MTDKQKIDLYERLHARMFPAVKNSLEYLTAYVSWLLGGSAIDEFAAVSRRSAIEWNDDITDDDIEKFRDILQQHCGELDIVDFAALINVSPNRVLKEERADE